MRIYAQTLLKDFFKGHYKRCAYSHTPWALSRRLINLLSQSSALLQDVDAEFYRTFMVYCSHTLYQLQNLLRGPLSPYERTLVLTALAYGGLCLEGKEKILRKIPPLFSKSLAYSILPDGGHITRNASYILEHLLDFLPLQHLYQAREIPIPDELSRVITRIFPLLRLLRHPDGTLALFNGVGYSCPALIHATFAYDNLHKPPLQNAPHSGYERVNQGIFSLIADVGKISPKSHRGYAGCLSFECSVGPSRLVINCGTPSIAHLHDLIAPRLTAAHSTATLRDESSCIFATDSPTLPQVYKRIIRSLGDPVLQGPSSVPFTRETTLDGGLRLTAIHDGYQTRFGINHQRSWYVSKNGDRLEGEDVFISDAQLPSGNLFTKIRFHLHPSVDVHNDPNSGQIRLILAHGAVWYFTADYGRVSVEESVFLAAPEGSEKTKNIVITFYVAEQESVRWCFMAGLLAKERNGSGDYRAQGLAQRTVLGNADEPLLHTTALDSVE
jgi:uncharacterized heparinase superfamily protein